MSWDLILFNSKKKIKLIEDVDESYLENIDFDNLISGYFRNLIQNENHIEIKNDDFSIEYFADEEMSSNKMLTLYGEKGIYEIAKFAKKYNLQIFDTALGKIIDFDNPENNGYKEFEKYLMKIMNEN